MAGEELKVAVYPATDEEKALALEALAPESRAEYVDMLEGWAPRAAVERMLERGVMVDLLEVRGEPAAGAKANGGGAEPAGQAAAAGGSNANGGSAEPAPGVSAGAGVDEAQLRALEQKAQLVTLSDETGALQTSEAGAPALDPRIHGLAERPEPAEALAEDVYNVRLDGPITAAERAELTELGAQISLFEPPATYRIFLTRDQYARVRELPFVVDVTRYGLAQCVAPELAEQLAQNGGAGLLAESGDRTDTYDCVLHRPEDLAFVRDSLAATEGAHVLEVTDSLVRFEAPAGAPFLAALAQLAQVRTLAPYEAPILQADYARRLIGVDTLNADGPERWTGEGEVVGLFDSGVDKAHPDLADNVIADEGVNGLPSADTYGHGSHVAGLIAGTGAASGGKIRGAAPKAKLASIAVTDGQRLQVEPDLSRLLSRAVEKGAKVINLSWGMKLASEYDQGATRVDKFVHDNPEVLVVVAAGNEGAAPQGWVQLRNIGTPATAKNVVTVGAHDSDRPDFPELTWGSLKPQQFPAPPASQEYVAGDPDLPAGLSSRGPANDYRLKPDLLAPGTCILSVRSAQATIAYYPDFTSFDGRYAYLSGTSMATPLVSGIAAVLRQYLREERDTSSPSAALLKAVLIAAAHRLPAIQSEDRAGVGYPDFDQGYGRLDLSSVLPHPQAPRGRRLVWDDVRNDSPDALESRSLFADGHRAVRRYNLNVAGDAEPLRIVLTWTDYPGPSVQNNLHLDVSVPGKGRVVGNAEHRFKLDERLDDWGGVVFDKRNTVEEVVLENPPPGPYSIRVAAQNTVFPPQGYALVACGLLESELERAQ